MAKDVFISYTTADKDIAYQIVDFLENNSVKCFVAPRDIDPGTSYASNLTKAIRETSASIIVASNSINASEHVLNELDVMVAEKKFILPFFIEDYEMNADYRYYLGRTQRIIAYPNAVESYFPKILDAISPILPKKAKPQVKVSEQKTENSLERTQKVFDYIPDRGIMINPEDHQRNVSFRTDTFINMFGGIYEEVVKLSTKEQVDKIFHDSGYTSGQSFAQRLNANWDQAQSVVLYEEKLRKWCAFDSEVGWGKFDIDVDVNEETGDFKGKLTISESFIVDNKNKREICHFMKGYCEGVIETLLGVKVKLNCLVCPLKNRFKTTCVFDIEICE